MELHISLPAGQYTARTRWGTHATGAAFDRKKTPYLTEEAQQFLAEPTVCVLAGLGPDHQLAGMLALGTPGFVQAPDRQTCLVQLEPRLATSRLVLGLRHAQSTGQVAHLGLFCMCHATRKRLCTGNGRTACPSLTCFALARAPVALGRFAAADLREKTSPPSRASPACGVGPDPGYSSLLPLSEIHQDAYSWAHRSRGSRVSARVAGIGLP